MRHILLSLLSLSLALFASAQDSIPNSIKYSDTSIPNATGRSGSASIEARALTGRNGTVDLDVSTGSSESGTSSGQLEKVKVKLPGTDWAATYSNLTGGGTFSGAIGAFPRGTTLAVTANVSGIDPNRVDIVSVNETVKLRPDLAVKILAAGRPIPGVPYALEATVRELNGDVGARANCVLYVDNVEVDRAPAIWVDAGSMVSCAFSHTFDAPGNRQLRVEANGVTPGDFDTTNNSDSVQIEVGGPTFDSWYASAEQSQGTTTWQLQSALYSAQQITNESQSYASFNGTVWSPFMQLENITGSLRFSSDGVLLDEVPNMTLRRTYTDEPAGNDGRRIDGCVDGRQDYQLIRACGWALFNEGVWSGGGTLFVQSMAGEVTFHSEGFDSRDVPYTPSYTWNYDYVHHRYGNRTPWGNSITLEVALTDGVRTVSASPTLTLAPFTTDGGWSYCYGAWWGDTCESTTVHREGVRASQLYGF
jgi:hypothetical protein